MSYLVLLAMLSLCYIQVTDCLATTPKTYRSLTPFQQAKAQTALRKSCRSTSSCINNFSDCVLNDINAQATTAALVQKNAELQEQLNTGDSMCLQNITSIEQQCREEKHTMQVNCLSNYKNFTAAHKSAQLVLCEQRVEDYKAFAQSHKTENKRLQETVDQLGKKHQADIKLAQSAATADHVFCTTKLNECKGLHTSLEKQRAKHNRHLSDYKYNLEQCQLETKAAKDVIHESRRLKESCQTELKKLEDLLDKKQAAGFHHLVAAQVCRVDKTNCEAQKSILQKLGR